MNILLPFFYKNAEYIVEYNEPDSTAGLNEYIVRIVSIKGRSDQYAEIEEQAGKEFTYKASEKFEVDPNQLLDLIIKTYRDHIVKDVDRMDRV